MILLGGHGLASRIGEESRNNQVDVRQLRMEAMFTSV